ncbi:glucuronate isomerase [bacterium]|nr:MAG: glucuronate isomerase [bacterium]
MPFIHDDFLLQTASARRLYHEYAAGEPILDYHNHLPPQDIAGNRQFADLFEIWLEGDHYKWRAMRANGIEERFCTGDAAPRDKFLAWARTVPQTLRNPLYHWTHLELARYFGIFDLLNEESAPAIWEAGNAALKSSQLTTQGILQKFEVRAICTTDDPADSLRYHQQIAASSLETRVYPTFRADKALVVHQTEIFNSWLSNLSITTDRDIESLDDMMEALEARHHDFHELGGRLSDHGLTQVPADFPPQSEAAAIFARARSGQNATAVEQNRFASFLMLFLGELDAKRGWTKQLHLGALRNNNSRRFREIGADTGFDSIGDWSQAAALSNYLDQLDVRNALPKTIIYNVNPVDNYMMATMAGNFQGTDFHGKAVAGKIQFGSGWWFLDQKEAMEWQINALSNNGLLSRFIGMLTDSRSFMSFPRHEYFRRVLCNLVGRDMESGELPDDYELVGTMIRKICYQNASDFLGLA